MDWVLVLCIERAINSLKTLLYLYQQNNSYVGDEFMRQIEPIAARVPYQTAVGNHEFA